MSEPRRSATSGWPCASRRHDEGVVESYYGPPEMATGVDAEPLTAPIDLVG